MQNLKEDLISNDDSTVTKIRFHVIKIVLDQGLMRYLKKSSMMKEELFY